MEVLKIVFTFISLLLFLFWLGSEIVLGFDKDNMSLSADICETYLITEKNGKFYAQKQNRFFLIPTVLSNINYTHFNSLEAAKTYLDSYLQDKDPIKHNYKRKTPKTK